MRLNVAIAPDLVSISLREAILPAYRSFEPVDGNFELSDSAILGLANGRDEVAFYRRADYVWCHSRLTDPFRMTSRDADWQISIRQRKGEGRHNCHGRCLSARDQMKSHTWIIPFTNQSICPHPEGLSRDGLESPRSDVTALGEIHNNPIPSQIPGPSKPGQSWCSGQAGMASLVPHCACCPDQGTAGLTCQTALVHLGAERLDAR